MLTQAYLQPLYENIPSGEYLVIDATVLPSVEIIKQFLQLEIEQSLQDEFGIIATKIHATHKNEIETILNNSKQNGHLIGGVKRLQFLQDIFLQNEIMTRFDFELITTNRNSRIIPQNVQTVCPLNIFIEEGATLSHCIINAVNGPVYIGKNATIMEGCCIRGPFSMGEGAVLKMGAKVYATTTIGPYCMAGGEIKNSILSAYSNKAHDGYLGDSVVGEWCNLGAGTTNSNVKNTAGEVELYNYASTKYLPAGIKCGVIMGDYSRVAINSSINTGTVIGISCNVFGNGLTPKFIPDFSWGFNEWKAYDFGKAIQDINNWQRMKNSSLSNEQITVLQHLYEQMVSNRIV